jgi:DNA replication protein DnaC
MKPADIDLDRLLKRLNLANTRRIWRDLIARAEAEQWSFHQFLATLVGEEIAQRTHTRLGRLSRWAQFPFLKTIEEFDFTYQSTVRLALLGSALSADFVTEGRSLVLLGKPGRGKTHLAVAIAYRAIQNGFEALFVTAAELIDELSAAFRKGRLAEALARFTHPHVLVVDEVGYLTYGTDAANMLFHVVNDRHKRRRSMIFTTNKPLAAWGRVLHDEDLAQAIVDRVLERGRLLHLDGPSMRTKHLGLDAAAVVEAPSDQVVRISGNHWSELPEPTLVTAERESLQSDDGQEAKADDSAPSERRRGECLPRRVRAALRVDRLSRRPRQNALLREPDSPPRAAPAQVRLERPARHSSALAGRRLWRRTERSFGARHTTVGPQR